MAFKNAHGEAPAATAVAYTCPASTAATLFGGAFCNIDGANDVNLNITMTDTSAGTTKYIIKDLPIPINDTFFLEQVKVVMEAGDTLQIWADAVSNIDYTLSFLEDAV